MDLSSQLILLELIRVLAAGGGAAASPKRFFFFSIDSRPGVMRRRRSIDKSRDQFLNGCSSFSSRGGRIAALRRCDTVGYRLLRID
ncbi:hypothetical protein EVAR_19741_1 [Eumeta japonica]|uniref:Secreted protein n=1 Tax=Eumeta variegata TaxID=151549 RepID=A0A4C1UR65_EUMVA|nr:hypothetical protein EVAR_19741_1 [Eumeta japonica]